jgi:4-amino-4-deoxychorismate lyase
VSLLAVAVGGRGLVDPAEPVLRADDEALIRGRGAFETMRVYGGRPFRFAEHVARLTASAERIGLPPVDAGALRDLAAIALDHAGADEAMLRLYWTPTPTPLALVSALPDHLEELRGRGQRLVTLQLGITIDSRRDAPWLLGGVKSTSYAMNMAAEAEAKRRGADDAIFLAHGGIVLEGPTTNVWWREGKTLYTPSLDLGILAGVTRGALLELSSYEVREGAFAVEAFASAEEVFTTSSVREVMWASEIDGLAKPHGEAARSLQEALRRAAYSEG